MFTYERANPVCKEINSFEPERDNFNPWIELSTENLSWNISQVRNKVEGVPIMAVIKCNAYGHGVVSVAKKMQENKIEHFAIAKVYEAVAMRENGIKGMILNFGAFSAAEAETLVEYGISQSVFTETIEYLAAAARKLNKKAKVHIKIETGLGRIGVPYQEAMAYIEKVAAMPEIEIEGVFTGLTEEDDFDPIQIKRLSKVYDQANQKGISLGIKHAESSLAVAYYNPPFLEMVRPGNCLMGFEQLEGLNLKPILSMKTKVVQVNTMHPGDTIGYHRKFKIDKKVKLAVIPLGYSDGYPLSVVGKAEVLIAGKRRPMVCFMSANHSYIDVTDDDAVKIGDEVVMIGKQGQDEITAQELANWAGCSVYQTVVYLNPLLPRWFV